MNTMLILRAGTITHYRRERDPRQPIGDSVIYGTTGEISTTRIAPFKMLPSGNRRAICDVTFCGPWGRGGLPREPGSEVGILESDLSALPASRAPGQAPDAD